MIVARRQLLAVAMGLAVVEISTTSRASEPGGSSLPPPLESPPLRNPRLRSPLPGGVLSGYAGDTGLDVGGNALVVHALAAGTLDYSERGHTRWTGPRDTAFSARLALAEPIPWGTRRVTHVYYTHMAKLLFQKAEGDARTVRVSAGQALGTSGVANGVPHLHLGLLCDGQVDQSSWDFILREHEVRKLLGGYQNGERLPPVSAAK